MEDDAEVAQKQLLTEAAAAIRADAAAKESRRPKNIGAGAMGLVGDSLGGVALGAAAIVVGPFAGYREGGTTGILKGAVGGLCIGVASTALGIGSGIAKLVDGASAHANDKPLPQLEAHHITENTEEDQRAYERERDALYEGLLTENEEEDNKLGAPSDTKLYEELGIEPSATPNEIRRAYFRLAQRYHPDKNPNDPTATAKFQQISDAYQVLSDPIKREQYHRMGSAESEGLLDPKSLFVLMFGNDKFAHLVGDLATSTLLSTERPNDEMTPELVKELSERRKQFQSNRQQKLAILLRKRLEVYVDGDTENFIEHAKHEVTVLRGEPFGRDMLHTIGYCYRRKAQLMLGKGKGPLGLRGFFSELSDKANMFRSKADAIEGGLRAVHNSSNIEDAESPEDAVRRETVSVLGAVWLASVVDIQTTLRKVVKDVLAHDGIAKEILRKRAEALIELGKLFQQA